MTLCPKNKKAAYKDQILVNGQYIGNHIYLKVASPRGFEPLSPA